MAVFLIAGLGIALLLIANERRDTRTGQLEAGERGEQDVAKTLSHLDEHWTLFSGVVVDGVQGDIDFVLLGPNGIFALEVKNWSGDITFDASNNTWSRINRSNGRQEPLADPAKQILRNTQVLEQALGTTLLPGIVFTNSRSSFEGEHPAVSVVLLPQLLPRILAKGAIFDDAEVGRLSQKMLQILKA